MKSTTFPTNRRTFLALTGATVGGLALAGSNAVAQTETDAENGPANGGGARTYRVTVANLTTGQPFTPPAVAAHRASVEVFAVGEPANDAIQQLAENGNLEPLSDLIASTNDVRGSAVAETPLVPASDPGDTGLPYYVELELEADASARYLTVVSMLIGTNDGFTGLDTVALPERVNESIPYYAPSFDAGTETNTEDFDDMVPPAQELVGVSSEKEGTGETNPDLAEGGVIAPHGGIVGDGDLDPEVYGWRDPAALVQVERLS
jgi:hypothetical protein